MNTFQQRKPLRSSSAEMLFLTLIFLSDGILLTGKFSSMQSYDFLVLPFGAICACLLLFPYFTLRKWHPASPARRISGALTALLGIFLNLFIFSDFIRICMLPPVSDRLICAGILLTAFYAALRPHTIRRAVHFIAPCVLFFFLLAALFSATRIRPESFSYLRPLSFSALWDASLPIIAVFVVKGLLLRQFFCTADGQKQEAHAICIGILLYGLLIMLISGITVSILGVGLYEALEYPLYYPLGLTWIGEYLERVDVLSVMIFLLLFTLKVGIFARILLQSIPFRKPIRSKCLSNAGE